MNQALLQAQFGAAARAHNVMTGANPIVLAALKQPVGREYADEAELWIWIHFDAAKRGVLAPTGYNFISRHLVHAQFIFARLNQPQLLEAVRRAGMAWAHAGDRPGHLVSLTTREYTDVRAGLRAYFRALHKVEVGTYREACNVGDRAMQ